MDKLSDKTVCVVDRGQFQEVALRLSRDFGRTLYYAPWKRSAPLFTSCSVGDGFMEIERVRNLFDVISDVDLFVFPDVYDGDLQLHLEGLGKRVWGSRKGEELEFQREKLKRTIEQVKLPVNPYVVITGLNNLTEYLRDHPDCFVKIPLFRGDFETFHHSTIEITECKLDALRKYYGPCKSMIPFMVEDNIETTIEVGYDGYCIDGKFTDAFQDYEIKNRCCIASVQSYDDLPAEVKFVNDAMAPVLASLRYRSPWGTEIRVDKQGTPFFIDATCRTPSPPGELLMEMTTNVSHIMWHGSIGEFVQAEFEKPYGVQVMIYGDWDDLSWQPIIFPQSLSRWVKVGTACKVDDIHYSIPYQGNEEHPWSRESQGCVLGIGDSIEDAIKMAKDVGEEVDGFSIEIGFESLAEALSRIQSAEEEGIEFGEDTVPEPSTVVDN